MAKDVFIPKGNAWYIKDGKRVNLESFREILDELAKCCGISCCENGIFLTDEITKELVKISVSNGVLIINPVE